MTQLARNRSSDNIAIQADRIAYDTETYKVVVRHVTARWPSVPLAMSNPPVADRAPTFPPDAIREAKIVRGSDCGIRLVPDFDIHGAPASPPAVRILPPGSDLQFICAECRRVFYILGPCPNPICASRNVRLCGVGDIELEGIIEGMGRVCENVK